ncbi:MAG TPA: type II secretion system F family protein, partial [Prochlorococcaceae cyanobacterium Fu_MAG_50]|nr:type II secretion system F family protein [Prochlorococcaceae cyanobacterium Fu_MAG_50]
MASFVATYESATGQSRTITVTAADPVAAKKLLRRRGIRPLQITANADKASTNKEKKGNKQQNNPDSAKQGLLSKDLGKLFEKPPGVKEKAVWASKLAALVDAG